MAATHDSTDVLNLVRKRRGGVDTYCIMMPDGKCASLSTNKKEALKMAQYINERIIAREQEREREMPLRLMRGYYRETRDSLLEKEEIIGRSIMFRIICGIYFLIEKNEIVYIGKSVDLMNRLASHRREWSKKFTSFALIEVPREDLDYVEALYINKFKPKYNRAIPPSP